MVGKLDQTCSLARGASTRRSARVSNTGSARRCRITVTLSLPLSLSVRSCAVAALSGRCNCAVGLSAVRAVPAAARRVGCRPHRGQGGLGPRFVEHQRPLHLAQRSKQQKLLDTYRKGFMEVAKPLEPYVGVFVSSAPSPSSWPPTGASKRRLPSTVTPSTSWSCRSGRLRPRRYFLGCAAVPARAAGLADAGLEVRAAALPVRALGPLPIAGLSGWTGDVQRASDRAGAGV